MCCLQAESARATARVITVDNQLVVEPKTPFTDLSLRGRIQAALERSPIVERNEITVSTLAGKVTLEGVVDRFAEKAEAEDVVSMVPGVRSMDNRLQVNAPTPFRGDPYAYPYYPYASNWDPYVPEQTAAERPRDSRRHRG